MRSHIRTKLISALKVCVSMLIFATATTTYAEYYIDYPEPYIECVSPCCGPCPCYHYLHFVSRHRHFDRGSGQVVDYAWIGDP